MRSGSFAASTGPIGFMGLAGAGKSTAARLLASHLSREVVSFAAPLKQALFHVTNRQLLVMDSEEKESEWFDGITYRQLMQQFGHTMRDIHPDIWVRALETRHARWGEFGHIIVDDVRYANEAAWIRSHGGLLIRINRDGAGSSTGGDHITEKDWQDIPADITYDNDGDLCAMSNYLVNTMAAP